MTVEELGATMDEIMHRIPLHLMTREKESRFTDAFKATLAALRYVRTYTIGLDDPETTLESEMLVPSNDSVTAATSLLRSLSLIVDGFSEDVAELDAIAKRVGNLTSAFMASPEPSQP